MAGSLWILKGLLPIILISHLLVSSLVADYVSVEARIYRVTEGRVHFDFKVHLNIPPNYPEASIPPGKLKKVTLRWGLPGTDSNWQQQLEANCSRISGEQWECEVKGISLKDEEVPGRLQFVFHLLYEDVEQVIGQVPHSSDGREGVLQLSRSAPLIFFQTAWLNGSNTGWGVMEVPLANPGGRVGVAYAGPTPPAYEWVDVSSLGRIAPEMEFYPCPRALKMVAE